MADRLAWAGQRWPDWLPADLGVVIGTSLLLAASMLGYVELVDPIEAIVGIAYVSFVPGYAVVASIFPGRGSARADGGWRLARGHTMDLRGVDGFERALLSIGVSFLLAAFVGLVLSFASIPIAPTTAVLGLAGLTGGAAVVAGLRRSGLPPSERYGVEYRRWLRQSKRRIAGSSPRRKLVTVIVVVALLTTVVSVSYAAFGTEGGETFTEFYLLTETQSGELIAGGYPTTFDPGESREVVVGIGNREGRQTAYTVVVMLQRGQTVDGAWTPVADRELDQHRVPGVAPGAASLLRLQITPTMEGERLRLAFLLYQGEPPDDPTAENAYRELHLWIDVVDS